MSDKQSYVKIQRQASFGDDDEDQELDNSENDFTLNLFKSDMINVNVGGLNFTIKWSVIEKLPNTRLGKIRYASNLQEIVNLCDEINVKNNEIYFDRTSRGFESIIDYYYADYLHLDPNNCVVSFFQELKFWGLERCAFDTCCNFKFHQLKEEVEAHIEQVQHFENRNENSRPIFGGCCPKWRQIVWDIMENPETSFMAKTVTLISIAFVLISTFCLVISTIPDLKIEKNVTNDNVTITETVDHPIFEGIEQICIIWFTFEYVVRLWAAPAKFQFIKDPLNIIDLVSILPFFLSIAISNLSKNLLAQTKSIRKVFTLFRVLRILRIFKLARHSKGLKAFGKTIHMSINELGILFLFLGIAVLLFSSLAYFAEKDEDQTLFTSIPATFWWSVITITTVGYGDMYPTTFFGRIIGIFCCIGGILVLAMPIPIIVDNFRKICTDEQIAEKAVQYKKERDMKNKTGCSPSSSCQFRL